jgi:type II secretory pathway pseudopilin PulG
MTFHGVLMPRSAVLTLRLAVRRAVRPVASRLRTEEGFGMIEILLAMIFITIAIMVLVSGFASATVAINRASRISTAGVIADSQMERYRAMSYSWIGLDTAGATDALYTGDTACVGVGCSNVAPTAGASACRAGGTVYVVYPKNCAPSQPVTGPDGRSYRLDTYVRGVQSVIVGNPRSTKLVTIVVRDPAVNNRVIAREESDFDYCTALPDPSGTGALC